MSASIGDRAVTCKRVRPSVEEGYETDTSAANVKRRRVARPSSVDVDTVKHDVAQKVASPRPPLCREQQQLLGLVLDGKNVFYTGGAGTGKSTVLRAMVRQLQQRDLRVNVVTPTGISALNVEGMTYFTYAGWTPSVQKKSLVQIEKEAMSQQRRARMRDTDVLIIDEISMLESNQFRRLDRACRAARSKPDVVFGGMQVVVTGDFYQLPPVKPFQTCFKCGVELHRFEVVEPTGVPWRQCPTCGEVYHPDDQWAFQSDTWALCQFTCVTLTQVHRQSDPTFVEILNTLRTGQRLTAVQLSLLGDPRPDIGAAVELSPVRRDVDEKNARGLASLSGEAHVYRCHDFAEIQPHHSNLADKARRNAEGDLVGCEEHRFPSRLTTKFGMPVILLANINIEEGLVNGTQGRIVGYTPSAPRMAERAHRLAQSGEFGRLEEEQIEVWVKMQHGTEFSLPVVHFQNGLRRVVFPVCQDTELGDPPPFSVVGRTQIPLLPAWAITMHKSQGMTLTTAVVNVDQVFEPQMAYVALSRVRALSGLRVVSQKSLAMLQEQGKLGGCSKVVQAFMERVPSVESVTGGATAPVIQKSEGSQ